MCGRYSMIAPKNKILEELPYIAAESNLRTSYNIAPTQHSYIVTNDSPGRLQYITWGLIPYWSSDGKNSGKLINARMEGIESKPSFRVPIRQRRCLVLADSFYEWKTEGKQKIPYRIQLKNGRLMLMAGIWDEWFNGKYMVKSFSIITTPPNEEMASIHSRMPLILTDKDKQKEWLALQNLEDVLELLQTPADDILYKYRVSSDIGSVKNNSPKLHQKVAEPLSLF